MIFFILGLVIGSFINAVVWRINQKITIVSDRSRCIHCHHVLAPKDLVPVFSWIVLRGKCRYCKKPISKQYPAVELLSASLFALSASIWDFNGIVSQVHFGFWLAFLSGLIILAVYDLRWMLLPDVIVLSLIGLALVQQVVLLMLGQPLGVSLNGLMAALLAGLFFFSLYAYSRGRWMGFGDVKLVILMGLVLGLSKTLIALLLAFNVAALVSLSLIGLKKLSRKDLVPFGPFLIGGTVVSMLFGETLFKAYLRIVGLG